MKKLNKKQIQILMAAVVAALVLVGGVLFATKDSRVVEHVTIEYGEKINDDEIAPLLGKNEMPEIDVMTLGATEYKLASGRTLIVTVEDTQKPVFAGDDKFTTDFGVEIDLSKKVTAKDPIDGDLKVEFSKVDYKKAGEQKVTAKAVDANGNEATKEIVVIVKEEIKVEEPVVETEATVSEEPVYVEDNSYTPESNSNNDYVSDNSTSNGGGSTSNGGGSSNNGGGSSNNGGYQELTFLGADNHGSYTAYRWAYQSWSWVIEVNNNGDVGVYGAGAPQWAIDSSFDQTMDMAF